MASSGSIAPAGLIGFRPRRQRNGRGRAEQLADYRQPGAPTEETGGELLRADLDDRRAGRDVPSRLRRMMDFEIELPAPIYCIPLLIGGLVVSKPDGMSIVILA